MATAAQRAAAQAARRKRVAARNAPKAKPKGPQPGQNVSAPAIAAEGRTQAAENIGFLAQQMPQATASFVNAQQGQIDAQAQRLDNPFLQQAQGIVRNEMGRTIGSPELESQMRALGASAMDYRPDQIMAPTDVRNVNAVNASAAQMGGARDVQAVNAQRVRNIRAGQVGAGGLGSTLMQQAMSRAANAGQLSPEASRDAIQAARQGMAARGMATGNAGLAAELLNRDRYSRARAAEDLAFAEGVQKQDIGRQFQNVANRMTAAQYNQQVGAQMSLANQAAAMDAQRLNQATDLSRAGTQAQLDQQVGLANQQAAMDAQRLNQARDVSLGQMSMDAQRLNQAANMEATGMNRAFMGQTANQLANTDLARGQYQLGLGDAFLATDPYRQAMQPGMQMGQFSGGAAGNAILGQLGGMIDLSGNAATFNTNRMDSLYNNYRNNQAAMRSANMQAGAASQAGTMGMIGSGVGAAIGIAGIGIAI